MDMVGTPYAPAKLWALTPDGQLELRRRRGLQRRPRAFGFTGLQNCKLGQSDHQAFFDVGIPSALFIWLDYRKPVAAATCTSIPQRHVHDRARVPHAADGMNNISPSGCRRRST